MNKILESILLKLLKVFMGKEFPQLYGEPETGKWYTIRIPTAFSSDGSKWQGYIRRGSSNKLVVYFFGGGVSVDNYTAARPFPVEGGFYNPGVTTGLNIMANAMTKWGIGNNAKKNPFRDWSFIVVPYCNGDFHAGTGEIQYTTLEGTKKTMFYHGFTNFKAMLREGLKYINPSPEVVMMAGASAGGFGAAILADHIVRKFPNTDNFTVCVDSAVLIHDKWHEVMVNQWKSPKELSDPIHTNNITVDALISVYRKHADKVKVLFDCSIRDLALSQTQIYFDRGVLPSKAAKEDGDRFQQILKNMVEDMQKNMPNAGIFIWDTKKDKEARLTHHTIIGSNIMFKKRDEGKSICDWIEDAVNGKVSCYGLNLLERRY